ncbi:MAG: division/cell wall cluster transcriptional repressor MraZ [Ostreibacterium sp.]
MFRGETYLSIDSKGRMTIPSKHRDDLTKLVVTPNPMPDERCLVIYPLNEWKKVEESIVSQPNTTQIRKLKRVFVGKAEEFIVDAQGRVLLPASMRSFAGLDKKVVMVGQINKLEIWSESAWALMNGHEDTQSGQTQFIDTLEKLSF